MTNKNIIERLKRNGSDISRHSGELCINLMNIFIFRSRIFVSKLRSPP